MLEVNRYRSQEKGSRSRSRIVTCFLSATVRNPWFAFHRAIALDPRIDFNARPHPRPVHGRSRKSKFADGERAKAEQVSTWYESVCVSLGFASLLSFVVEKINRSLLDYALSCLTSQRAPLCLASVGANAII